jgi:hypothetical protein
MSTAAPSRKFASFEEFYPFYLGEHADRTCRRLHVIGTTLSALLLAAAVATQHWWLIPLAVVQGYAWAWVGHFVFEKNRPATFQHPWWSYRGDLRMLREIYSGKIAF